MSFNGSGTFVINSAGQPVVANTVISSTVFNALTADLATGLSTCITKDGQTTPTANIPMGNNKITGLAAGTLATDAANLSQVQSTAAKLITTVAGADTITGTLLPTLTAYATGQMFYFVSVGANTGAVTLNIDGLGAKAVTRDGSSALAAGDINSGEIVVVVYDGTRFQMINAANSFGNTTINGTLTVTGKSNLAEVSTPSINATVAAITTLTASDASVTSANANYARITNLHATGASVASINAAVALLTTATVTSLTATGASIASANIGSLNLSGVSVASANFGVANVTDLRATGASVTSANLGNAVITTMTVTGASVASANVGTAVVTGLTATGASVASANIGTALVTRLDATGASVASINAAVALVTTGTVTNLTSTNASIASANVGVANITDFRAAGASVTSANVGTAVVTTMTVTGASIASANMGRLDVTNASAASINAAVALLTTGAVTNLTSTSASIASANLGNAQITSGSIASANVATLRFTGASSGYVGFVAQTSAGSVTYTWPNADGVSGYVLRTNGSGTLSWVAQSGGGGGGDVTGPASSTDNAVARFDLTTGKIIQNSQVIVDDSGTVTGVASLAATTVSATSANLGTAVITTLTATQASVASINAAVALFTTGTVTTLTSTQASIASANVGTFVATNASIASANANILTVSNASVTSANIATLTVTGASITSINDQYGKIRAIPQSGSDKTSTYTISAGDNGRFIGVGTSGKIIIPNATMATGDAVTLYNATTGNVTVECSISIAYIAGTNTDKASVTLATRGVATILFLNSDNCVMSGNLT
jgi:uncharacterized protein YjbI with pentapeptide repeats